MRRLCAIMLCASVFLGAFTSTLIIGEMAPSARQARMKRVGTSGALEALDFWTSSRAYPAMDIPRDGYAHAYQHSLSIRLRIPESKTGGSVWSPIGPLDIQGRALSVAINPLNSMTIYVGTASGGLWRSFTRGLGGDWHQVRLAHPALGISAIVIDPADTNVIFIGTGEVYGYRRSNGGVAIRTMRGSYGIGILRTTDGGTTWTASLDWSYNQERGVQALKLNPVNRHTLWAATSVGLYRSVNDGGTWEAILDTLLGEDILIDPADTNRMMVSFGNLASPGRGIYRSLDGGTSWRRLAGLPDYSGKTLLAIYSAHPNVVYASVADSTTGIGGLWRTTDFGDNWIELSNYTTNNIFGSQGWYSHFVAVHPADSSIVVHNSVGLSRSTDGGRTFAAVLTGYADNHGYAVDPQNPDALYAANDDGVYRSADFGRSYVSIGFGMQTSQFYNGFSCSATDSFLALGQNQDHLNENLYRGGMRWEHPTITDEVGWTAIDPGNDSLMYTVFRFGQSILKSTDRGMSFRRIVTFNATGCWNSPMVLSPSHPHVLFFGDTRVRKSTNRGMTWFGTNGNQVLDGNPVLSMAISATNPDTVYAATAPRSTRARVFRTTNGGTTWTNITGTLPDRYPMDMAVDPQDAGTVFLALGGFGTGHVYKSVDAGQTWSDVTGVLPDVPATAIALDPLNPNVVYAGNDIGVYASTDGGSQWYAFSEGLPDAVIIADLTVSPSNRSLRIASHGNGVWERSLINELPPDYFDYRTVTIDFPIPGTVDTVGAPFGALRASFSNLSSTARSDSFTVRFRVLKGGTEVHSATKRIPGLGFGETRQVVFPGAFLPPDTAVYSLQAMTLGPDQYAANDTLTEAGALTIVSPPTMRDVRAVKQYAPYEEISDGMPGPSGDDVQQRLPLPFPFLYDGFVYDSCQISTNGWLEFGTGPAGLMRGLSTEAQLGGYFTANLAARGRPSKALGLWWTDLSTNGTVGEITSMTIGSSPARVFVVQWRNMLAYFDPTVTSTYVNFQVRLYETTNGIEYRYGHVAVGAFPDGATGASIGLKDYVGGDYRYYDVMRYATGLSGELRADLSPLTDWPGADSCYRITTSPGVVSVREPMSPNLPERFALARNYPNPFNPVTTLRYTLPAPSVVTLRVYNILGEEVATLVDGPQEAGQRTVQWDATGFASGVYLCRLTAGDFTRTRKMVLAK